MNDFGSTTTPVARKVHRCEWCGEMIAKGAAHHRFAGRWSGEWQDWRMHDECYARANENYSLEDGFAPYENARPSRKGSETCHEQAQ